VHSPDRVLVPEIRFHTHSPFQCSKVSPKSAIGQTIYVGCPWKWVRSHEQNSVSESRRASLYSVSPEYQGVNRYRVNGFSLHGAVGRYSPALDKDTLNYYFIITSRQPSPRSSEIQRRWHYRWRRVQRREWDRTKRSPHCNLKRPIVDKVRLRDFVKPCSQRRVLSLIHIHVLPLCYHSQWHIFVTADS